MALTETSRGYKASGAVEKSSKQTITGKSTFYSKRSMRSLRYLPFLNEQLVELLKSRICFYMSTQKKENMFR